MYHHGDLKNKLIEEGIKIISKEGVEQLSLRRVAAKCGVSHAAPYSHFKNKEELITAMQHYIDNQFFDILVDTIKSYSKEEDLYLLILMGKTFILFFLHNPHYYQFLFFHSSAKFYLDLEGNDEGNYPPWALFKSTATRVLRKLQLPDSKIEDKIITYWSIVKGVTSLATMPNVIYSKNWEEKIEDLIRIT